MKKYIENKSTPPLSPENYNYLKNIQNLEKEVMDEEITISIKNKTVPVVRNMMKKMSKTAPNQFHRIKITESILKDKNRKTPK